MIGVSADEVVDYVAGVASASGEYLEIVNYNIAGQQYAVAGTLAGLEALKAATGHPKAFVMIPGIDVPFHSAVLRPGVPAFAEKLDELLPHTIDIDALVGRYVPNLVARPFALDQEFIDAIAEVVPTQRLAGVRAEETDQQALARDLLIELLSWQFASPVRWIETQELLIGATDRLVEVGLASSPTLSNLALRSMEVLGVSVPVHNVERDQDVVMLADAQSPPAAEVEDTPAAEETPTVEATATPTPAPAEPTPAPAPAAAATGPVPELPLGAAEAVDVLFAYQNKVRVEQIEGADTTEILTGGVTQ